MATNLSVMTWNVENLFNPGSDPDKRERFQVKLDLLSAVVSQSDVDIVAFQEVGGEEPFAKLQQRLPDYAHRVLSSFPDGRGIRVGFLSRLPIDETEDFVDFPPGPAFDIKGLSASGDATCPYLRMGRGALRARVSKSNRSIDLVTLHLKSKLLSFPKPGGGVAFVPTDEYQRAQVAAIALLRRTAEAATVRTRINDHLVGNAGTPLVLLGDFNDVPEAQTTQLLQGPPGSEIGTRGFHRADKGDDARLFNLAPLIAAPRRYSRIYRGSGELLDQIFVSEELLPREGDNKRRLPQVDSLVDFVDALPSIEDDPRPRQAEVAPDHAPVVARFEL